MSEDRLEKAINAMREEIASHEQVAAARTRVWEKLADPRQALCLEFRAEFQDYLDGRLTDKRRLLIEDHLGRCPQCRALLTEQEGRKKVIAMPRRPSLRWVRWGTWAATAALVLITLYLGRSAFDTMLAPRGPRATVTSLSGGAYRVEAGPLKAGDSIADGELIRTGPNARALLHLYDGSQIDVNENSELFVQAAWSGKAIHLQRGDIVVQAAKQHRGYLRVQTRDSMVSVKGTVFAVSTGLSGTLVSVVEGSVAVAQPNAEVLLGPGGQAASNPSLKSSVQQAVSWSPSAEMYLAILAAAAKLEQQIASLPSPSLRNESELLPIVPPGMVLYGAVPNLSSTITQAMELADQQSAENPIFGLWWKSSAAQGLRQLVSRIQAITPLLGDEIVYGFSSNPLNSAEKIPMILSGIRSGKKTELAAALNQFNTGTSTLNYHLTDSLMVISDSPQHLQWLFENLGQGASAFTSEIAARYQDGVEALLAVDMASIGSPTAGGSGDKLINVQQVKHLFIERRSVQGVEENEMVLTFKGPRTALASFLANSGSGGAAEYLTSDAIIATYAATREPQQMFDEISGQLARSDPAFLDNLAKIESKLGISISNELARSLGNESAFAVESLSTAGPIWVMAGLVNDELTLESTIRKLVEAYNADQVQAGKPGRIVLEQETSDGRKWTNLKRETGVLTITWTFDRGYMVAGSERGAAMRALATRNGGSSLIWSSAFRQQLSSSAGLHPSGFVWLNTKGAFQNLASLVPNPIIKKLASERDPVLAIFNGTAEQIQAVSRTRLSGLIMDILLLQGMGRARTEQAGTLNGITRN
jgi:hypothetical protein